MVPLIYSFIFFFGSLFTVETITQKEQNPSTKTIYIVNITGKKIHAIFKPVTTVIESGEVEQTCCDPEQPVESSLDEFMTESPSYSMEFSLFFDSNQEMQKVTLTQQQLGTKDLFEGILDWSTATTCTLLLYDEKKEKLIKKDFKINDKRIYQIEYINNQLVVKDIN